MIGNAVRVSAQELEGRLYAPSAFFGYLYFRTFDTELLLIATVLGLSATVLDEFASVLSTEAYNRSIRPQHPFPWQVVTMVPAFLLATAVLSVPLYIHLYRIEAPEAGVIAGALVLVFGTSLVANRLATTIDADHGIRQTRLSEFQDDEPGPSPSSRLWLLIRTLVKE